MKQNTALTLIQVIDNRIKMFLNKSKFLKEYSGIVTDIINDSWVQVRIAGDETVFTMQNQSGNVLHNGDSVYIKTIGNDMNTGVVVQRFATKTILEETMGIEYHNNQYCVMPVHSVVSFTEEINPSLYYGGQWEKIGTETIGTSTIIKYERIS